MRRTLLSRVAAAVATFAVAGCSGAGSIQDTFNNADVRYAEDVVNAHQRTLALAELAAAKSADPAVLRAVSGTASEARAEITMVSGYVRSWGRPDLAPTEPEPHVAEADDPIIQGQNELAALNGLTGAEFDRALLLTAVAHNREYVARAERQPDTGYDQLILGLARSISQERRRAKVGIESALGS